MGAAWTLRADLPDGWLGAALATGDLDGDGRADLAAGAPGALDGAGAVAIWWGAAWPEGPGLVLAGRTPGDHLGTSLAIADWDGDGVDDLAAGAPRADEGGESAGLLAVLAGGAGLPERGPELALDQADRLLVGTQPYLQAGGVLAAGPGLVLAGLALSDPAGLPSCDPE